MCTRYRSYQYINDTGRDPELVRRLRVEADVHLAFVCELLRCAVRRQMLSARATGGCHIVGN